MNNHNVCFDHKNFEKNKHYKNLLEKELTWFVCTSVQNILNIHIYIHKIY